MKNTLHQIIWGKDKKFNGLIALGIVTLIVLGCNCNKLNELAQNSSNTSTNPSNTFSPTNTGTAPTPATPTYTKADASKKQIPSEAEMQELVKTTLLDFNSSVQTEDFSSFHSTVSKLLQRQASPEQMKQKFQLFIDGEMDISAIKDMNATFTMPAQINRAAGTTTLETKGEYPTYGVKTSFEFQFIPEGKDWKLIKIQVYAPIKRK